jgi:uncharacterized membrane protein
MSESSPEHPFLEFRGHELGINELPTALVHLYRAQVGRADVWRARLDSSTNWAVVTTAAALTVTFSEPNASHLVIPLCAFLVTLFWGIESRRYRYFELWSYRVHILEEAYFGRLLSPEFDGRSDWHKELAESLRHPQFTITLAEALGRRYRRIYVWVYTALALSWCVHIWIHPAPVDSFEAVMHRPVLGYVPAYIVLLAGLFAYLGLLAFGLITYSMKDARGEVFQLSPTEPEGREANLSEPQE